MAGNNVAETAIGAVVIAAAVGFVIYAGQVSGRQAAGGAYALTAEFRSVEGIAVGTDVRLAGIRVGSVTGLDLDPATYQARASFTVDAGLTIPEDSDVKIASEGLLGGSFLEITPGASEFMLAEGDAILNTQSSVSLLNLLMRFGMDELTPRLLALGACRAVIAAAALAAQSALAQSGGPIANTQDTLQAREASLRGLDTLNGATEDLRLGVGETARFGYLEIGIEACRVPREAPESDAYAFVVIRDVRETEPRFSGWMFASSPALSALDHPRYDVWVLSCSNT